MWTSDVSLTESNSSEDDCDKYDKSPIYNHALKSIYQCPEEEQEAKFHGENYQPRDKSVCTQDSDGKHSFFVDIRDRKRQGYFLAKVQFLIEIGIRNEPVQ